MIRTSFKGLLLTVVLLGLLPSVFPQDQKCFPNASLTLQDRADSMARFIVQRNRGPVVKGDDDRFNSVGMGRFFEEVYLYTVIEAVAPTDEGSPFRTVEAYQAIAETARTDKQVGASARSEGSTSASEKPGFVDLLGFAIEHGAIQQNVNDTTLTLSTTPYALIAAASGDTAENYRDYEFFTRLGVSASFNIGNKDNVLTNANRQQLSEWSARARLYGDKSPRSQKFIRFWNEKIRPAIVRRLQVVVAGQKLIEIRDEKNKNLLARMGDISDPADPARPTTRALSLNDKIAEYLNANQSQTDDKKVADIKELILCHLNTFVVAPIRSGEIVVDETTRMKINAGIVPSLIAAHRELQEARKLLSEFLKEFKTGPEVTFAYSNKRVPDGQNYQVFKFLYEQDNALRPMKVIANAGLSIYNNPDPTLRQQRVRDFAATLTFEGEADSPFTTHTADLSKLTYSFTGRYQRMLENRFFAGRKADIGSFQFRLDIPFLEGLSLPLAITYSNATEQSRKDGVRVNFGMTLDADKLLALRKLANIK